PNNANALEQLALLQGWTGRYEDAIKTWELGLSRHLGDPPYYYVGIARVSFWKGDTQRSLHELERALALQPTDSDAWTLQGDVLLSLNRIKEARASYQQALAISPQDSEIAKKLTRAVPFLHWR